MKRGKKHSERKSHQLWDQIWKEGLKAGVCPVKGCDIKEETCEHLDEHLRYQPGYPDEEEASVYFTDRIEEYSREEPKGVGAWELFKKLRQYGLNRDQIGILVRKFAYNMSREQIKRDMNYTSNQTFDRRYKEALATLKKRGFK